VIRTRVGYAGGTTENPTYDNIADHTETIQVDYDPAKISYAELLKIFWASHNPCAQAYSRQYMSAIFTMNDEQKRLALETRPKNATTLITPLKKFTLAEDYHQKYSVRNNRAVMDEFKKLYPNDADFVSSTAAARVNALLAGNARFEDVASDIPESIRLKLRD
jgi:methionine-S-sulfoxide reductase